MLVILAKERALAASTKTVLITLHVLVDLPAEADGVNSDLLHEVSIQLEDAVGQIDSPFTPKWSGTEVAVLDPSTMNCGRCKGCGCWASDRDKPEFLGGLNVGAVVDGDLLCDECLPLDHPRAF